MRGSRSLIHLTKGELNAFHDDYLALLARYARGGRSRRRTARAPPVVRPARRLTGSLAGDPSDRPAAWSSPAKRASRFFYRADGATMAPGWMHLRSTWRALLHAGLRLTGA
ncbi:hypothetical protein RKD18_008092 [Streptomyces phaeoluteigriseus]